MQMAQQRCHTEMRSRRGSIIFGRPLFIGSGESAGLFSLLLLFVWALKLYIFLLDGLIRLILLSEMFFDACRGFVFHVIKEILFSFDATGVWCSQLTYHFFISRSHIVHKFHCSLEIYDQI